MPKQHEAKLLMTSQCVTTSDPLIQIHRSRAPAMHSGIRPDISKNVILNVFAFTRKLEPWETPV